MKLRPAEIFRGDTWLRAWAITADGLPLDTSGATVRVHLKKRIDDATPVLAATSMDGEITLSTEAASEEYPAGRTLVSMAVPKEKTELLDPGKYVFDMEYTFGDGTRRTYEQNTLEVRKDATV